MNFQANTQAMLLLTCELGHSQDVKPLSVAEWKRFAIWLNNQGKQPSDCLEHNVDWLYSWQDSRKSENPVTVERLQKLLNRGNELALAVERWQRVGIWVITRAQFETSYPQRLRKLLTQDAPPVLFGCGNPDLLNKSMPRVAVVGSRKSSSEDNQYAYQLGLSAAKEQMMIVSGGAKGIDEAAMLGAIENGGEVIGVIADNLFRLATDIKWRSGLMEGRITLISPFNPENGFSKYNAMARNDYIYCLSDAAIVVHSGKKGGTFSGAEKNLKKQWVPLWVKPSEDQNSANAEIVRMGGKWLDNMINLEKIVSGEVVSSHSAQVDLFSQESDPIIEITTTQPAHHSDDKNPKRKLNAIMYQLFLEKMEEYSQPVGINQLKQDTGLQQVQIKQWLEQGLLTGDIQKTKHQYQLA